MSQNFAVRYEFWKCTNVLSSIPGQLLPTFTLSSSSLPHNFVHCKRKGIHKRQVKTEVENELKGPNKKIRHFPAAAVVDWDPWEEALVPSSQGGGCGRELHNTKLEEQTHKIPLVNDHKSHPFPEFAFSRPGIQQAKWCIIWSIFKKTRTFQLQSLRVMYFNGQQKKFSWPLSLCFGHLDLSFGPSGLESKGIWAIVLHGPRRRWSSAFWVVMRRQNAICSSIMIYCWDDTAIQTFVGSSSQENKSSHYVLPLLLSYH